MSEPNTYADERRAIELLFKAEWADRCPVRFENMAWDDPRDDIGWLALFVLPGPGRQITLNDVPLHRYDGTVIAQVFQKERTGTETVNKLAGQFAEVFRGRSLCLDDSGLIRFRTPSALVIGANSGWYQINVNAPYFRDTHHSRPTT